MRLHFASLHPFVSSSLRIGGLLAVGLAGCTIEKDIASDGDATTDMTTAAGTSTSAGTEPTGGTSEATTDAPASSTTTDASSTTTEPAQTCPDHANTDACCCFEAHSDYVANVCGTTELCATVGFDCDMDEAACVAGDLEAIDCALKALAGPEVGLVQVQLDYGQGWGKQRIELYLQGDGTAYVLEDRLIDVGGTVSPTGRYDLKEPSFFTDCLAASSFDAKAMCFKEATTGPSEASCVDGFDYEDF